jgi:pimeloyl-ACP methyl ester carboxylesterase
VIGTLILACTYDCNVAPLRERLEANVLLTLLRFFSPGTDHARRGKWARYFGSPPWLRKIKVSTLVVAGTHDTAVPQRHFDTLVRGVPGASGRLVDRAGHTLEWAKPRELA